MAACPAWQRALGKLKSVGFSQADLLHARGWGLRNVPLQWEREGHGRVSRQAKASVLQDDIGPDSKSGCSKDLELSLSVSWDILCISKWRHWISELHKLLEVSYCWFNWKRLSKQLRFTWQYDTGKGVVKMIPTNIVSAWWHWASTCFLTWQAAPDFDPPELHLFKCWP